MTISQIKEQLGLTSLDFFHQINSDGQVLDFLRAWDNNPRTEVIMHKDVSEKLYTDKDINILSLQDKGIHISASGLEYRKYFIVIYSEQPAFRF